MTDHSVCVSVVLTLERISWTAREERQKLSLALSSEENNGHESSRLQKDLSMLLGNHAVVLRVIFLVIPVYLRAEWSE